MSDITLTKQLVKVAHINLREEKHGEENVMALDLKLEFDTPNDFLSYLHPTLKWSLFGKDETQGELLDDKTYLPMLRYPELETIQWKWEMTSTTVLFHGAKKSEDLELSGRVNQLRLTCKDGGTVAVSLRVQVLPTASQASMAVPLLGKEIKVSISKGEEAQDPGGAE